MSTAQPETKQLLEAARQARQLGLYNRETLKTYFSAWYRSRSFVALAAWLMFQRDLGYPLRQHQYQWLKDALGASFFRRGLAGLYGAVERQAKQLCNEYEFLMLGKLNAALSQSWQQEAKSRSKFLAYLSENAQRIAIVGNGPSLIGSQSGKFIDEHACVLRFNQFSGKETRNEDNGIKLDVWVTAPDFKGPVPKAPWVIISGPAMQFRLKNWLKTSRQLQSQGARVLCIPIEPWRELVQQLGAPPSAGLLVAYWLVRHADLASRVSLFGFGHDPDAEGPYHQADYEHPPNSRHNWAGEREILKSFPTGE